MIDLDKIKYRHTTVAICCVANCCSGMLIIWQFQPELFFTLDIVRFILWAYALSFPWLFCHYIDMTVILELKNDKHAAFKAFFLSTIFTTLGVAGATLLARSFNFPLRDVITFAACWFMAVHLIGKSAMRDKKRELKTKAPEVLQDGEKAP